MQASVRIAGCGKHLPSRRLRNDELAERFGVAPAWIEKRTGIVERRIAAANEAASDLAMPAATGALEDAGVVARDVDVIIVATSTPDTLLPSTACRLQAALGARPVPAFDISASCAGFVYALAIARSHLAARGGGIALVVASEIRSRFVDPRDVNTVAVYGDGAGAVVLASYGGGEAGVLAVELGSQGTGAEALSIPAGGSRRPATRETVVDGLHYVRMDGSRMTRSAVRILTDAISRMLSRGGLRVSDIDLVVPHQMNSRIISAVAKRSGLSEAKVFVNLGHTGNTAAASIPIAVCDAVGAGRILPGHLVLLATVGAGFTWGTALIRWS